ncbi:MAG TPA: nucleoside monophosphate kinase [Candidatus Dormibacteraeota bacterium]|nr:nucleoside monophosphate kinase [Candidatus Dormibacteraeota bacterium]
MILLMGIAGSGKGTQGKMLADARGFHLISMGEVLRMYVTGEQRERMLAGELLPDDEIIKIVDKVLTSVLNGSEVLMDGFPRTIPQAQWLLEQVKAGRFKLDAAFHLVASREAVKKRLLSRARIDDIDAAIEERFNEYERSTAPLLKWLSDNGVDVIDVDAERSVEAVNDDIVKYLDNPE